MLVGGGGIVFANVFLCIGVVRGVCGDSRRRWGALMG